MVLWVFFFRKYGKIGEEKNGDTVNFPLKGQKSLFLPVTFAALLEGSYCSGIRIL